MNIHRTFPRDLKIGAARGVSLKAFLKAMGGEDCVNDVST